MPRSAKFFPEMRRIARQAFLVLEKAWQLEGGTLVDLKVEFGFDTKGNLLLADVIDNNSWRVIESGAYIDKQVYRDGGALDDVAAKYRQVAEITSRFRMPRQRIILWRGSEKDKTDAFSEALGELKDMMTVVTCSMHKEPVDAAREILNRMIQEVPDTVVIANIGRSNGAGPVLSAMSTIPVITVPASVKEFPEDVWSSLRAPSAVPVMTVLEPANAVLAALQILSGPQSAPLCPSARRDRGARGERDGDLRRIVTLRRSAHSSCAEPRRPYVPSIEEATRPRCECEGCPDRPGRASSKEGESWAIIAKRSWLGYREVAQCGRDCGCRADGRDAVSRRDREHRSRDGASWCASSPSKYARLTFCYEAGPTGYGLYRLIKSLGHDCMVVAPSLIPKKPGDRVKTNRRDADRSGEAAAGRRADRGVGSRRASRGDARSHAGARAAVDGLRSSASRSPRFCCVWAVHYPGKKTWTKAHQDWLASLKLEHREQRIAFEEMLLAVRQAQERIERLEQAIRDAVPDWSLAEVVTALMAMRGIDLVSAATFLAEIGDLSRFETRAS